MCAGDPEQTQQVVFTYLCVFTTAMVKGEEAMIGGMGGWAKGNEGGKRERGEMM